MTPEQHFDQAIINIIKQIAQQASIIEAQAMKIAELEAKLPKEKPDATPRKTRRARVPAGANGAGESAERPAVRNGHP